MPLARRTTSWLAVGALASALVLAGTSTAGAGEHTVVPGENLTVIAARYCTSVSDLLARNAMSDPHLIHVGTRLHVADRCGGPSRATATTPAGEVLGASADRHEIAAHLHLVPMLRAAADEFDVPSDLLMALTYTESRWRSERVSAAGAVGIGQILPATAAWLRSLMAEPDLDETDSTDNVRMSARLLRFLLDRTATAAGTIRPRVALAAYFQGIGDVLRNGADDGGSRYANVVLERRRWFTDL
jgi:Transglycosylase SLT domain/LysM domain